MFTGYSKEESEMMQFNLHPGGTEGTDFAADDNTANNTTNNSEANDIVTDTNNFNTSGQFEFDMAGDSLW